MKQRVRMPNNPRHIILGISGGIAAYKSLSLIRLLQKNGAEVRVVATPNALQFVTPLSLQTLSCNAVYTDPFKILEHVEVEHVALADWGDALVVAPATADVVGKFANGIADDALTTLFLAFNKPVVLAPAMNHKMLQHPAVVENLQTLSARGCHVLGTGEGYLACGTNGSGRMLEPEQICDTLFRILALSQDLSDRRALVTAGPTYEPLDPVRFIGNHSSGLMGFCLAESLARHGAQVVLVTGPTHLELQNTDIQRIDVMTAQQMLAACEDHFPQCDIAIMSAAVADYTPQEVASQKIKKQSDTLTLTLKKNPDILSTLGHRKTDRQCVVGFALETENELENARLKLQNKNADIIVLNSLNHSGAGFKTPTNQVTIIDKKGHVTNGNLKDKREVAEDIVSYLVDYMSDTK